MWSTVKFANSSR